MFIANWKMNLPNESLESYIKSVKQIINNNRTIILAVPYPYLFQANNIVNTYDVNIKIAAQNMCYKENGAYTGEISVEMLLDLNISYVIIGHSERRHIFKESNQDILKKVELANKYKLNTILCVGETLQERNREQTFQVLQDQLEVLKNLSDIELITIAYEPVWAIGTGNSASPDQIQKIHSLIRDWVSVNFNKNTAKSLKIIYGGSVNPHNIYEISNQKDVDGGLVGGASLSFKTFSEIIHNSKYS